MRKVILSITLILGSLILSPCTAAVVIKDDSTSTRILFIGNSYSSFNNLPQLVENISNNRQPDHKVVTKLISGNSLTLKQHWQYGAAQKEIKEGNWDYVVLQEQSTLGTGIIVNFDENIYIGSPEVFYEYARKFHKEINASNAKTVFLMTWANRDHSEQQIHLSRAYLNIAEELDSIIAPVGLVWELLSSSTDFDLYYDDGSHPSLYGSYLAAFTLYSSIFNNTLAVNSDELTGDQLNNSGIKAHDAKSLVSISVDDALVMQKSALEVINSLRKTVPYLVEGENITHDNIQGQWFCNSKSYYGLKLDISVVEEEWNISLTRYLVDKKDTSNAENIKTTEKNISFLIDIDGKKDNTMSVSINDGKLLSRVRSSYNDFVFLNDCDFTKNPVQNSIDLASLEDDLNSLLKRVQLDGYSKVMSVHWKKYAVLTGSEGKAFEDMHTYRGLDQLSEGKISEAIEQFKLVVSLFQESADAYYNLAKALEANGNNQQAKDMFRKAYEIAMKNNHPKLSYYEKKLTELETKTN
jgi:tetratricopeptide (TPR) repeat protein